MNPHKMIMTSVLFALIMFSNTPAIAEEITTLHTRLQGDVNGDGVVDEVSVFHSDEDMVIVNTTLGDRDGNAASSTEWMRYWRGLADAYLLMDIDRNGREDLVMVKTSSQPMEWRACRSDGYAFYHCSPVRDNNIVRRILSALIGERGRMHSEHL